MKYGVAFIAISIGLVYYAIWLGDWAHLLLWPALSFLIVAMAYLTNKPAIFLKSAWGQLPFYSRLLLAPYLIEVWLLWHVLRAATREAAFHQISEQFIASRRLLASELPDGVDWVIDLTCEFTEPTAIREMTGYRCLPTLDGSTPPLNATLQLVEKITRSGGTALVHCAQGHGRTAMLTTIMLVRAGDCDGFDDALARVQKVRPEAKPNHQQIIFAKRCIELIKSKAAIPPTD